jgi:cysteine synthase A
MATDGFAGTIGNTPLMRLPKLSAAIGRETFGKAEFLNPAGSLRDRAGRHGGTEDRANGRDTKAARAVLPRALRAVAMRKARRCAGRHESLVSAGATVANRT